MNINDDEINKSLNDETSSQLNKIRYPFELIFDLERRA